MATDATRTVRYEEAGEPRALTIGCAKPTVRYTMNHTEPASDDAADEWMKNTYVPWARTGIEHMIRYD